MESTLTQLMITKHSPLDSTREHQFQHVTQLVAKRHLLQTAGMFLLLTMMLGEYKITYMPSIKVIPYQLVILPDARLLQPLMDGMFLQLPQKFTDLVPLIRNLFQHAILLDVQKPLSPLAMMSLASTLILEEELILSQEKENHGFMENPFTKENLSQLAVQLDAKLLVLLLHGACQPSILMLSTTGITELVLTTKRERAFWETLTDLHNALMSKN